MTEIEMQQRFDELVGQGFSAEDAMLRTKIEAVGKDYQKFYESGEYEHNEQDFIEELENLYTQLRKYGYSVDEAMQLISLKASVSTSIEAIQIKLGRYIPVDIIKGWEALNEKRRKEVLWDLGFNTRGYKYFEDVCCRRWDNKLYCGKWIYSQERTDREWLTKTINGVNMASIEARFHKDMDTLAVMKGNKKG